MINIFNKNSLFLLFACFLAFNAMAQSTTTVFQAGASISEITPFLGARVVGNYNSPPATYIHDPLNVRAVVMDDGVKELYIVIIDNVSTKREVFDAAKAILNKDLNIDPSQVLMAATHTHSGVSLKGRGEKRNLYGVDAELNEYQAFVVRRIVDGVKVAIQNKQPAKIAFGKVEVPDHVFNRRWVMKDSVWSPLGVKEIVKTNPGNGPNILTPAGPIDPEVSFIAIESKEGKPIALLANYSLHYVGYVPKGHVSADYFAEFANYLKELMGEDGFVGIMSNGTSGDINNNDYSGDLPVYPPYKKIEMVAHDVADKVMKEYQSLKFDDKVELKFAQSEMTLDVRRASPELLATMARVRDHEGEKLMYHRHEKTYASRIFDMEADYPDSVNILLQTFGINDIGIAAIPFEVFAEIGLEIKANSPYDNTFTIELANGSYGYLPSPEQHKVGGYETWLTVNRVEKTASDKIEKEILRLFKTIHK